MVNERVGVAGGASKQDVLAAAGAELVVAVLGSCPLPANGPSLPITSESVNRCEVCLNCS